MAEKEINDALAVLTEGEPATKKRKADSIPSDRPQKQPRQEDAPHSRVRMDELQNNNEDYDDDDMADTLDLCNMGERKRFLIRSINAIRRAHPEAYQRTRDFANDEFAQLDEKQLIMVYEILREEAGLSNPYDNSQAITSFIGTLMENTFGLKGISVVMATDPEIISMVQAYLPGSLQKFGGIAKVAERVFTAVSAQYLEKKRISKEYMDRTAILSQDASKANATTLRPEAAIVNSKVASVIEVDSQPKKPTETQKQ